MEKWMQSVFHFGNLVRSEPPPTSPTLDEFDFLHFLRPTYDREPIEQFRALLNVTLLEPEEVLVEVVDGKILEVTAKHCRKVTADGLWMTRDLKYTFEIPEKSQGKGLKATWSEDEYLLIEEQPRESEESYVGRVQLIPKRVVFMVRPAVELRTVRDIVLDIRDKAADALRYIGTHMGGGAVKDKKKGSHDAKGGRQEPNKEVKQTEEKMECEEDSDTKESSGSQTSNSSIRSYCA